MKLSFFTSVRLELFGLLLINLLPLLVNYAFQIQLNYLAACIVLNVLVVYVSLLTVRLSYIDFGSYTLMRQVHNGCNLIKKRFFLHELILHVLLFILFLLDFGEDSSIHALFVSSLADISTNVMLFIIIICFYAPMYLIVLLFTSPRNQRNEKQVKEKNIDAQDNHQIDIYGNASQLFAVMVVLILLYSKISINSYLANNILICLFTIAFIGLNVKYHKGSFTQDIDLMFVAIYYMMDSYIYKLKYLTPAARLLNELGFMIPYYSGSDDGNEKFLSIKFVTILIVSKFIICFYFYSFNRSKLKFYHSIKIFDGIPKINSYQYQDTDISMLLNLDAFTNIFAEFKRPILYEHFLYWVLLITITTNVVYIVDLFPSKQEAATSSWYICICLMIIFDRFFSTSKGLLFYFISNELDNKYINRLCMNDSTKSSVDDSEMNLVIDLFCELTWCICYPFKFPYAALLLNNICVYLLYMMSSFPIALNENSTLPDIAIYNYSDVALWFDSFLENNQYISDKMLIIIILFLKMNLLIWNYQNHTTSIVNQMVDKLNNYVAVATLACFLYDWRIYYFIVLTLSIVTEKINLLNSIIFYIIALFTGPTESYYLNEFVIYIINTPILLYMYISNLSFTKIVLIHVALTMFTITSLFVYNKYFYLIRNRISFIPSDGSDDSNNSHLSKTAKRKLKAKRVKTKKPPAESLSPISSPKAVQEEEQQQQQKQQEEEKAAASPTPAVKKSLTKSNKSTKGAGSVNGIEKSISFEFESEVIVEEEEKQLSSEVDVPTEKKASPVQKKSKGQRRKEREKRKKQNQLERIKRTGMADNSLDDNASEVSTSTFSSAAVAVSTSKGDQHSNHHHQEEHLSLEASNNAKNICLMHLMDKCHFGSKCFKVHVDEETARSLRAAYLAKQCKYWPNCTRGDDCLYFHPASVPNNKQTVLPPPKSKAESSASYNKALLAQSQSIKSASPNVSNGASFKSKKLNGAEVNFSKYNYTVNQKAEGGDSPTSSASLDESVLSMEEPLPKPVEFNFSALPGLRDPSVQSSFFQTSFTNFFGNNFSDYPTAPVEPAVISGNGSKPLASPLAVAGGGGGVPVIHHTEDELDHMPPINFDSLLDDDDDNIF